jgi:glycolate oxidase FAD binding subunit
MEFLERIGATFGDRVLLKSSTASDAVDGVLPCAVVEPRDEESAQELVAWCGANGIAFVPRGGGTKLGIGARPARCELVISTKNLTQIHEHDEGNATVEAGAGVALDVLNAEVEKQGQYVPLDWEAGSGATLGGVVASNHAGETKLRYGAPRDLVVGLHAALSDGRFVKSGSKVVKNVSGYDLNKLLIGSYGTLGLLTRVTIRLRPNDAVRREWRSTCGSWEEAQSVAREILEGPFEPAFLSVVARTNSSDFTVRARFDGGEAAVASQFARLPKGAPESVAKEHTVANHALAMRVILPRARALTWAQQAAQHGATKVSWEFGLGIVRAEFESTPADATHIVSELRALAGASEGVMIVTTAVPVLKTPDFVWGAPRADFVLQRRLKNTFDAAEVCAPGRFVGGL